MTTMRQRNRQRQEEADDPWRETESSSGCDGSYLSSDEQTHSEYDDDDDCSDQEERIGLRLVVSLRRRVRGQKNQRLEKTDNGGERKQRRRRCCRQKMTFSKGPFDVYDAISSSSQRVCRYVLIFSIIFWIGVEATERYLASRNSDRSPPSTQPKSQNRSDKRIELMQIRQRRVREAKLALGSAAIESPDDGLPPGSVYQDTEEGGNDVEALPSGCVPSEWQTFSFPNCNDVHEIDLRDVLGLFRRKENTTSQVDLQVGYVGSGMWRTVWKVHPRGPILQADGTLHKPAVLKTMKTEHEVDARNFDRHRRDALVMERLTSSPNVIDIYGFCGNTILSEYLEKGLDRVIFDDDDNDDDGASEESETATRETPIGRLQLALGAARGVAALHSIPGGPIIHADVQDKQFLVDANGIVKINDFNRCRFVAHHNETQQACPVRIPQAPGAARAPEEYAYRQLTEQLDMFSLGHVLYEILTGRYPWGSWKTKHIRDAVRKGRRPFIDDQFRPDGSSDDQLAKLIDSTYEYDPKMRITATELVQELENILAKYGNSSAPSKQ